MINLQLPFIRDCMHFVGQAFHFHYCKFQKESLKIRRVKGAATIGRSEPRLERLLVLAGGEARCSGGSALGSWLAWVQLSVRAFYYY